MDPLPALDVDGLRAVVADAVRALPRRHPDGPGAVGLESESFCVRVHDGHPAGRVDLAGLTALLDDHPDLDAEPPSDAALTGWRFADGARLVPEPGAQLEYVGLPHPTAAAAITRMTADVHDVALHSDVRGTALVSAGLDQWHPTGSVAQGLRIPRYPAMHRYLRRRSAHGHVMMTGTASLQVNLDLGDPAQAAARWATALMVAPLAVATFASSPTPGAVNGRAVVWQWLDPTRTGIPPAFVDGADDPVEVLTRFALAADVMLFDPSGAAAPGEPGFTFDRWLRDGHPRHGRPTAVDAAYHLTTLFPEVRARGCLEVRGVDALPARWRAVPVVLYCGLLYDDAARDHARAVVQAHRPRLPELLRRAAHLGLADPELCALAVEVWYAAADGARRLPDGYVDPADIHRTERFLDRFTLRGRTPSDELRERLAEGPAAALGWARETAAAAQAC